MSVCQSSPGLLDCDAVLCCVVVEYQRFTGPYCPQSSGCDAVLCCVVLWQDTNVSEVHSASYHTITRRHTPDDLDLNLHCHENLVPHQQPFCFLSITSFFTALFNDVSQLQRLHSFEWLDYYFLNWKGRGNKEL
jgi:hypothetical protein